jgi:hypothetical protein
MRQLLLILVSFCGVQLVGAEQPIVSTASDTSSTSVPTTSTILADALWNIANSSRVPIGFESVDQPMEPAYRVKPSQALDGFTLTEALNAAVSIDKRYEWRFIDDMVVVRPKTAWTDAADPLNLQVHDLDITSATVGGVLSGLQGLIYDNRVEFGGSAGDTVSLRVESGTVLHVLNQLTKAAEQVMWLADHRRASEPALRLWVRGPRLVRAWAASPIRAQTRR